MLEWVSTHSRPKAAGTIARCTAASWTRFNTQPPEGGWLNRGAQFFTFLTFQHTAARRRLGLRSASTVPVTIVSTHSRPKAAGVPDPFKWLKNACFNTQPPEGGWRQSCRHDKPQGGFNTQPPEGGWAITAIITFYASSFNTQPPEGGWGSAHLSHSNIRRFNTQPPEGGWFWECWRFWIDRVVSTHSRPKAAG